MPISKAASENVLPAVTACELARAPVAMSVVPDFVIAQWVAVPLESTTPSEKLATVTLRPDGVRSAGAPIERPVFVPSLYVDDAPA